MIFKILAKLLGLIYWTQTIHLFSTKHVSHVSLAIFWLNTPSETIFLALKVQIDHYQRRKKKFFLLSCYAILPKLIGSIYQTIKINLYYLQNKIYMIVVGVWINDGSKNWYLGGWTRSDLKTTQSSQCGSKKRWLDMPGTIQSVHHRDIKAD